MKDNIEQEDFSELERAFFNDGYHLAGESMEGNSFSPALYKALGELYTVLDSFIDIFLENAENEGNAAHCKKGCSWCCHQAVFAQAYEFRYLKHWMFENLSAGSLEEVRKRARIKQGKTALMDENERLLHKEPCPLLVENACIAYEARPVACRIYLSMSVDSCTYEYDHPEDKSRFPALFDLTLRAGRRLNEGFAARLQELGYDVKELPLEEGVAGL